MPSRGDWLSAPFSPTCWALPGALLGRVAEVQGRWRGQRLPRDDVTLVTAVAVERSVASEAAGLLSADADVELGQLVTQPWPHCSVSGLQGPGAGCLQGTVAGGAGYRDSLSSG